jgi:hypothetical protein
MTTLLRCSRPFFRRNGFTDSDVLAHFFHALRPDSFDRAQLVNAFGTDRTTYAFSGSYPRLTGQFRELAATPVRLPYSDSPAAAAVFVSGPNRRDKKNRQRGDSCGASNGTAHAHGRMMTQDGGI